MKYITEHLDRIAAEIQGQEPVIALALDRISDQMERYAAKVNTYLGDFFELVSQLPGDGEVIRKIATQWPSAKSLLKTVREQAVKDESLDAAYIKTVFEDFSKASELLDKLAAAYKEVLKVNPEGIKTFSESIMKMMERMKGDEAPAEEAPVETPAEEAPAVEEETSVEEETL